MNQFLKTKPEIEAWLNQMSISKYQIVDDSNLGWVVNVKNSVFLDYECLNRLPVRFGAVEGNFYCRHSELTSLLGSPQSVEGGFNVQNNQIQSLLGAPTHIGEFFICDHNLLTKLHHAPQKIRNVFSCSHNQINSLLGGPVETGWDFWCDHNRLINFEGCPFKIDGSLLASHNLIDTLLFFPQHIAHKCRLDGNPLRGDTQNITDFQTIFEIHQCQAEQAKLSTTLGNIYSKHQQTHKL